MRVVFWSVALVLGLIHAWAGRHWVNGDGFAYLDIADAYWRGDWNAAVNAYWSPFYSWILAIGLGVWKPHPKSEFAVLHFVNLAIYLGAFACFEFFWRQVVRSLRAHAKEVTFPEWAWAGFGCLLFLYSSLDLIKLSLPTPDMCVAAFVYLASGILLRIRMGEHGLHAFALLGGVLGFGYLAKAAMFPLAFVFIGVAALHLPNLRARVSRVLVALVLFGAVGGSFMMALSKAKGRLTFGDAAKLNYAWSVNGTKRWIYWNGEPPGSGKPLHPVRKILETPAVYEFGSPVGGTYPLWHDPSYWYEGLVVHLDLTEQVRVLARNFRPLFDLLFGTQAALMAVAIILFLAGGRGIRQAWFLLVPPIAAVALYSLVTVESRYIAAFLVVFWAGIFSGLRLPGGQESQKLTRSAGVALLLLTAAPIAAELPSLTYHGIQDLARGREAWVPKEWAITEGLTEMGLQAGDPVAGIGYNQTWARMGRFRIVAEVVPEQAAGAWRGDPAMIDEVIRAFSKTGAKAVVTDGGPGFGPIPGWQRIANTQHYVWLFNVRN